MEIGSLENLRNVYTELENKILLRKKVFKTDLKKLEEDFNSSIDILNKEKELLNSIIEQLENLSINKSKIAMFIDSDNVSVIYMKDIMKSISEKGEIVIKKAFGNWEGNLLTQWNSTIKKYDIEKVNQEQLTFEKNATDMRLTTDIVDIYHQNKDIDEFIIVSSDSDYTPVVKNLTEKGKKVTVYGKSDASKMLKKEASEFINYEDFKNKIIEGVKELGNEIQNIKTEVKKEQSISNKRKNILTTLNKFFKEFNRNGKLELSFLGSKITPKEYGFKNLKQLIESVKGYSVVLENESVYYLIRDTENPFDLLDEVWKNHSKPINEESRIIAVEFGIIGKSINVKDLGFKNVSDFITKSSKYKIYRKSAGANYMLKKK